jgi:hypothetical protein
MHKNSAHKSVVAMAGTAAGGRTRDPLFKELVLRISEHRYAFKEFSGRLANTTVGLDDYYRTLVSEHFARLDELSVTVTALPHSPTRAPINGRSPPS